MAIEANYVQKIEEIKQVADTLTAFETKFIFGEGDSRPILERDYISDKQKAMIDRIWAERVQGQSREEASVISFGNDRVSAMPDGGNKTYRVVVDGSQVGAVVSFGEATNVVAWLSCVLTEGHLTIAVPAAEAATPAADDADGGFPGE